MCSYLSPGSCRCNRVKVVGHRVKHASRGIRNSYIEVYGQLSVVSSLASCALGSSYCGDTTELAKT